MKIIKKEQEGIEKRKLEWEYLKKNRMGMK